MIPAEAVEAAAKVICNGLSITPWERHGPQTQEAYRDHARAALEAAAPHMVAEFKRQAAEAMDSADEYIYPNAKQRRGTK